MPVGLTDAPEYSQARSTSLREQSACRCGAFCIGRRVCTGDRADARIVGESTSEPPLADSIITVINDLSCNLDKFHKEVKWV